MTELAANTTIAAAEGTSAALTGSPALLAETLHTVADAGNEVFLWVALRRSRRAPDATHPLGYGPERYYWALLAAVGMFVVGGTLSVWEGVNGLIEPPRWRRSGSACWCWSSRWRSTRSAALWPTASCGVRPLSAK